MPSMPDALLLCGGAGLRLREVTGSGPKSMATVAGRPFLELLLKQLRRNGFDRAILAVGYQKDVIRSYFGERAQGLHLAYSAEASPLGTGGALRNAADLVESDTVLIMNGDSYTDADLVRFVIDHDNSKADASMVVVPADGRTDCGSVLLDQCGIVECFEEKQATIRTQYLNAGIYLVSRRLLYDIPPGLQVSLERELLPRWLKEGNCIQGFVHAGTCVDIGTPERYQGAQDILANTEVQESASQSEASL
jgi:NDP-sugar pyrophosphorylase family protein